MKKYLPIIQSLLIAMMLAGCIFVADADQAWNDGQTDIVLIGTWTGTNTFKSIQIEKVEENLIISGLLNIPPNYTAFSNIYARTTKIHGVDTLIIKDIWPEYRKIVNLPSLDNGKEYPAPFAHGYMLVPYSVHDNALTLVTSVSHKIEALIRENNIDAFLPNPPPERDFTPPIFMRLDSDTISVLIGVMANESFWEKQEYLKSEQSGPAYPPQGVGSADP